MHLNRTFVAVAASAALVLSVIPAQAQRRGDDHGSRRSGGGQQARGQAQTRERAVPRETARENATRGGGERYSQGPRGDASFNRGAQGARPNVAPSYSRGYGARNSYRSDRDDRGRSYSYSYGYRGGYNYRGGYGSHPSFFSFYAFRPRLSLGFGLWMGYPIAYPYDDYYTPDVYVTPAPYPSDSYAYQQAPPAAYPENEAPQYGDASQQAAGGVSFEITPEDAAVFVDGTYVGTAATFGPAAQPLGLTPGRHRIDIRAAGYRTMTFDADVTAGQVIPYRGVLSR